MAEGKRRTPVYLAAGLLAVLCLLCGCQREDGKEPDSSRINGAEGYESWSGTNTGSQETQTQVDSSEEEQALRTEWESLPEVCHKLVAVQPVLDMKQAVISVMGLGDDEIRIQTSEMVRVDGGYREQFFLETEEIVCSWYGTESWMSCQIERPLENVDYETARKQADEAAERLGWNLIRVPDGDVVEENQIVFRYGYTYKGMEISPDCRVLWTSGYPDNIIGGKGPCVEITVTGGGILAVWIDAAWQVEEEQENYMPQRDFISGEKLYQAVRACLLDFGEDFETSITQADVMKESTLMYLSY